MRLLVILLLIIMILPIAYADTDIHQTGRITDTIQDLIEIENPKAVTEMDVEIVQSGTLTITGDVNKINITLYIPQESVKNLDVSSNVNYEWSYVFDAFGNRQVLFEWDNVNDQQIEYSVVSLIESKGKHTFRNKRILDGPEHEIYLAETEDILFSTEIKELAFPFERTLKRAADLSILVHNLMEYDIDIVGQRQSSIWALENEKGVCVEHANLLAALLRSAGIPTRYVVGYAYSYSDKKLIGHTWVEVPVESGWVPFDPTWLQGGNLDATHIITSRLLDDNQKDRLMYVGRGQIDWQRNKDEFEINNFNEESIIDLSLSTDDFAVNTNGYIELYAKTNECSIVGIDTHSCVDESSEPFMDIYEKERKKWICGNTYFYWMFSTSNLKETNLYGCPVTVYEDTGSSEIIDVGFEGSKQLQDIFIRGPNTISVNELFDLEAVTDNNYIFFSPSTKRYNEKEISISLSQPG
ncbi:transglutaminase family protein, partial [Candidatus Aenigmatarchaeota archaeon]